ncbi:MAG: hypothetical protein JW760_06485 [Spirochaetales bacterium]|nr:hypothetical protein [Spirochaetales bacterium]
MSAILGRKPKIILFSLVLMYGNATGFLYGVGVFTGFILESTSADNPVILELLLESDMQEALDYTGDLGRREDADVGSILSGLLKSHEGRGSTRVETVLLFLLEAVFFHPSGNRKMEALGLPENRRALKELQEALQNFSDSGLKGTLLILLPDHPAGEDLKVLLRQGTYYLTVCEQHQGFFPGDMTREVKAYIEAAGRTPTLALTGQIAGLRRICRDKTITALAGEYLGNLE